MVTQKSLHRSVCIYLLTAWVCASGAFAQEAHFSPEEPLDAIDAAIRIVLDPRERHDFVKLGDLSDTVRIKRGVPLMHLKAYEIDGQDRRFGSILPQFAHSGDLERLIRSIVNTDSGDHEHPLALA